MKQNHILINRRKFIQSLAITTTFLSLGGLASCKNKTIRFGLATDSHYADRASSGTRYYRQSLDKLKEFVEVMNQEKVDFVMHLGDFKDEDTNKRAADTLKYLQKIEGIYAEFNGPRFHCVGNHDVDSITKTQFLQNIVNSNIAKEKSYYSFNNKGFHFVVLDANFHEDGRDHFYKEGANWQDTNIPAKQLDWLKKDLKQSKAPTIVFCHHPLFKYERSGHQLHVNNYQAVQQILIDSKKVVAVFQGHVHEEKFVKIDNLHYITQLGMVDHSGLENNSFALIEIDEKGIQIKGYKRATEQFFENV